MGFPMTTHTTHIEVARGSIASVAWQWLKACGRAIVDASESSARLAQIRALEAKSDDELAELGLKREDIPRYVFRDLFYI